MKFRPVPPPPHRGSNTGGRCKFRGYTGEAIQDRAIVTIERLQEIICTLSNRDISDDLVTFEGHFGDPLIVVTLCTQLMRDLLAIAKFFVWDQYALEQETVIFCGELYLDSGPRIFTSVNKVEVT